MHQLNCMYKGMWKICIGLSIVTVISRVTIIAKIKATGPRHLLFIAELKGFKQL